MAKLLSKTKQSQIQKEISEKQSQIQKQISEKQCQISCTNNTLKSIKGPISEAFEEALSVFGIKLNFFWGVCRALNF